VVAPTVVTGIEEPHAVVGHWVDAGQVRPFVRVTVWARERQVVEIVGASVLAGANVLNVEREERRRCLQEATLLTPVPGSLSNRFAPLVEHCGV
jgi:hypothetical protein